MDEEKTDPPLPRCEFCEAQSADCAYGNLRGGQSCFDRIETWFKSTNKSAGSLIGV